LVDLRLDDHLDKRSIVDIEHHFPGVRYVCPSGLARWFVKLGIDAKRVTELGWWEAMDIASPLTSVKESEDGDDQVQSALAERPEAVISPKDSSETLVPSPTTINPTSSTSTKVAQRRIRLVCCPAQHNSGRGLLSRNKTLWASWYLIHEGLGTDKDRNTRVYFGG
jgi:L-ascorbate metabolism protein UlaG (beta-lactamase superfamily)